MQQIRGMKVKDPATSTAADAVRVRTTTSDVSLVRPGDAVNNSSHSQSDIAQSKAADKAVLKNPDKKAFVRDGTPTESSTTANQSVESSSVRQASKKAVVGVDLVEDRRSPVVAETNAEATTSVDKQTAGAVLRTCARCHKEESTLHEFKKCKK